MSEDAMAQVRLRARRRLLGAVVLVLAAVVGLPLILETQPRPVAKDISIDVRRDGAAGVSVDSPLTAARPLAEAPDAGRQAPGVAATNVTAGDATARSPALVAPVVAPTHGGAPHSGAVTGDVPLSAQSRVATVATGAQPMASPVASAVRPAAPQASGPVTKAHLPAGDSKAPAKVGTPATAAPARATAPPPAAPARVAAAAPAAPPKPTPAPRPDDKATAKPAPDAKPTAAAGTRFVLQVGAFEHAAAARETRGKVEKLGLKAYEQEVDAAGARRIRVRLGPYASREEAERMLQKLRAGGMSASVVPL